MVHQDNASEIDAWNAQMNQVSSEDECISVVVNGEKHYTDGKRHYIERDHCVLEYIGPLDEAPVDVIAAFLEPHFGENKS